MKNGSILKHGDLTEKIIAVFYDVYNELGHGFLESVYHRSFEYALSAQGFAVRRKIKIPVWFRGQNVGDFEADVLVEDKSLVGVESSSRS